ncbi:MAG: purine-nucleoside phosphorylase [Candidatus Sericytochromatia bacterium]|uniref:Purine nucleoside phosphorylase n=1 Tax=Candidatus Tanganyikabacteria bacterium TaxID=2961651 RepID=A0A938BN04_9BACT|nr:purine-nucleoside phosphorylase [Candidatus Tanganyikabacteria bacterium]
MPVETPSALPTAILEARDRLNQTVGYLQKRVDVRPAVGMILGSGLGELAKDVQDAAVIPYSDIPNFPLSTAPGHAGNLVFGKLSGQDVVLMQGRFHTYEGYSQQQVTFPIRVMKALGAETLIVTCASGGLNKAFNSGDLMLISDHINLTGSNPLVGPNDPDVGPRFPVMFDAYRPELRAVALQAAINQGVRLQEGVYAGIAGPVFFTRAELRYLQIIGADALGMSTVPEVIVAVHCGLKVMGLALISDMALPDATHHATEQDVLDTVYKTANVFRGLVKEILANL